MQLVYTFLQFSCESKIQKKDKLEKTVHDTLKSWTGTLSNIDLHELQRNSQSTKRNDAQR